VCGPSTVWTGRRWPAWVAVGGRGAAAPPPPPLDAALPIRRVSPRAGNFRRLDWSTSAGVRAGGGAWGRSGGTLPPCTGREAAASQATGRELPTPRLDDERRSESRRGGLGAERRHATPLVPP